MEIKSKLKVVARQALMVALVALVLGGSFMAAYTALALTKEGEKNNPVELKLDPTGQPGNKNNEGSPVTSPAPSPTAAPLSGEPDNDGPKPSDKGTQLVPKTLPAGIISPENAIDAARKGFHDYFGLNAQDAIAIDTFSHDLATVYGSGELYEPLLLAKAFAGKQLLLVLLHTSESDYGEPPEAKTVPPVWSFQLLPDGANDGNIVAGFSINAQTGEVIAGGLVRDVPQGETYSSAVLKQMAAAARQYVEKKEILGQAVVAKVENIQKGPDVSVTLSDGRVIVVTVSKELEIINFHVKGVWDNQPEC